MKNLKLLTFTILLSIFSLNSTVSLSKELKKSSNAPENIEELKSAIQTILKETNTASAGVALVLGDSTVLVDGIGLADVEKGIEASENTIYRIGSVSKMYTALAILKLQESGQLTLKDKIRDIIPEMEFHNPWKDKHPIRIEHLLEHTAGFSYWHYGELGSDDPKLKTLKEALDFYPKSRTSLFVPGTRFLYSNVGTCVAAYIVEKVSGIRYEDYIQKNFFEPMGMESATFFESERYKSYGAKLYEDGIKLKYFNILYRPAGAMNASPKDMVGMIKFFVNRGKINNKQILSESSLNQMKRNDSFHISESNMFKGNGKFSFTTNYRGFEYHGHGGHLPGTNADFGYMPEHRLGYAVMINDNNENVISKIVRLIKAYQTRNLTPNTIAINDEKCNKTIDISGYYNVITPKMRLISFLESVKTIQKVWYKNDTIHKKYMLRQFSKTYLASKKREFNSIKTGNIAIVSVNDPVSGEVLHCDGMVFKKISSFQAYLYLSLFWTFFIIPLFTLFFGFIRLIMYLFQKKKNNKALWICLWPVVSISFVVIVFISIIMSIQTSYDSFQILGTFNSISVLIFICGVCFALASVKSVIYIFKNRRVKISRFFYYHSMLVAVMNLIYTAYFLYHGLIGIPTWM